MKEARQEYRHTRRARRCIGVLASSALVMSMATGVYAVEGMSPSDEELISRSAWGSYNTSRVFEPWAEIPLPFDPGSPMTEVRLGTPTPKCEARAAGYWASYALEEGMIPGALAPVGYNQNPTLAKAANPPYAGSYGDAPIESEVAPAGKTAGPYYAASCPSPLSGSAMARHFHLGNDSFTIGAATSDAQQAFKVSERLLSGETFTHLTDVNVGAVKIRQIGSWVKTELKPDAAPVVSYRITLKGVSTTSSGQTAAGSDTVWLGNGVVLAGQNVPVDELVAQFNEQLRAHENDLAVLGRYRLRVLAPRVQTDEWHRHFVEAPVVEAGFGPKARERQTGHFQAIRLGVSRFIGKYTERPAGETPSEPAPGEASPVA